MATPNYGYEKRQRELAKRQKKEEKLRAKADRKVSDTDDGAPGDPLAGGADAEPQAPGQPGEPAPATN